MIELAPIPEPAATALGAARLQLRALAYRRVAAAAGGVGESYNFV